MPGPSSTPPFGIRSADNPWSAPPCVMVHRDHRWAWRRRRIICPTLLAARRPGDEVGARTPRRAARCLETSHRPALSRLLGWPAGPGSPCPRSPCPGSPCPAAGVFAFERWGTVSPTGTLVVAARAARVDGPTGKRGGAEEKIKKRKKRRRRKKEGRGERGGEREGKVERPSGVTLSRAGRPSAAAV